MSEAHTQSGQGQQGAGDGSSNGTGADNNQSQPTGTTQSTANTQSQVDLKTLTGDQLNEVLENPNLWNNPRIKELREAKDKLKTLEEEKKTNEDKALEENKKFEELAKKRADENQELVTRLERLSVDNALTVALQKEGIVDLEAGLALADRSSIKVDKDGKIEGVAEVVASLKEGKEYLFTGTSQGVTVGSATNNNGANNTGAQKFKRSQLRDAEFYKANRDEILKAQAAGLIENDL